MDASNTTTNGTAAGAAAVTNGLAHDDAGAPAAAPLTTMSPYTFPVDKLRRRLNRPGKTPLVLVACGSYSPITVLHVQMFHMAERHVQSAQQQQQQQRSSASEFEVVGSYLSPVSDAYKKPALARAHHRLAMCQLAVANTDIMVDAWEALRCDATTLEPVYTSTVDVLDHVDREINYGDSGGGGGGIETSDGLGKVKAHIALLMGADVAATMGDTKQWPTADVDAILGRYGAFVIERPMQTQTDKALASLRRHDDKIWVVEAFENDVSSTKIRAQLKNGERVLDLAQPVYEYIKTNDLYYEATGHAKTNGAQ